MNNQFYKSKLFWALLALCLFSFAGHLAAWPFLPDAVPCHWGASGQVDGWMPKSAMLLLDLLPLGLLVLFQVLPGIDPKKGSYEKSGKAWPITQIFTVVLLVCVTWSTELAVWNLLGDRIIMMVISAGAGAMLLAIGNYMPQIKQNYTFGVKTPWALADEHCWQRSQRMGGITMMAMGVYTIVAGCAGIEWLSCGIAPVCIGGVIWMYVYSYLVYIGKMK
ncbi:MAG: SdpI family protein [Gemmiger sp.]